MNKTAPSRTPNIYTAPTGRPFLDSLAEAILSGNLPVAEGVAPHPIDIPAMTLLLPTRRATRAVQEAFLRAGKGQAMLLPRIKPIAEGEEDLMLMASTSDLEGLGAGASDIPPAINELERRLALTSLVMRWSKAERAARDDVGANLDVYAAAGAGTPAQCAQLAKELASLMDMVETEGVSLANLDKLVPENFSEHWQKTLNFLKIVVEMWPDYLAASKQISPAGRRNRLILAEAAHLTANPPQGPVIVAGVTGSIPATVALMRAVANLPNGAIVLPELDMTLDEESWQTIVPDHPEHPQYGLKKLLDALGVSRAQVKELPGVAANPKSIKARDCLISEAMRPAATTVKWHSFVGPENAALIEAGLNGISLIEAPSAQDEAEVVSLILREALETPGRTAALVSPDRLLARRVAVRLESWGIRVDDSAGRPFGKTPPGAFLDLIIEAVHSRFAPSAVMSLLKHPLTRLGLDPFAVRRAGRALELAVFRRPYLGGDLAGIGQALERAAIDVTSASGQRAHSAVKRLWKEDWDGARDLVAKFEAAFAPLAALYAGTGDLPLTDFARAHAAVAEALAKLPELPVTAEAGSSATEPVASALWSGEAGFAAKMFFDGLFSPSLPTVEIRNADYADLYRGLVAGETVRPRVPVHPRLSIWGPFEARLQQPDVVVLGSLNDGTWPEPADPGPWLNRPMRAELGLPSPEEQIGYSAHDFTSLLNGARVYLTRAQKTGGVPAVPSRWLLRLEALLAGAGQRDKLNSKEPWLNWARARDMAESQVPITMPAPKPPVNRRPRKLSVSRVETWIGNPYAIYASEILRLQPLDAIGLPPSASLRGSMIHEALSRFVKSYPKALPANTKDVVLGFAREVLDEYAAHPRVAAFWVPRFERFAEWFADTEPARRQGIEQAVSETKGTLIFEAPGGAFQLTARADRIDVSANGLVITDYKTGNIPGDKKVVSGFAPQLPLEAAIAMSETLEAGFEHVPKLPVVGLRYIKASGGEPPGDERDVKSGDIVALASAQLEGLKKLVFEFDKPETPYSPQRRARFSYDYDDFAHLARVAEWSAGGEEGGEGE
ncbi:MAG: double-strand break repair protein AddB [Hyphomicrobium sp.]